MPFGQDDAVLHADFEQYLAGACKTGHYTNEEDISVAIGQQKVFVFSYSNVVAAASIVIIAAGAFWLWGSLTNRDNEMDIIPVVIWCGIFFFAGVVGLLAKARSFLMVGPHGIVFRSFFTLRAMGWSAVQGVNYLPLGRPSDPFRPVIRVRCANEKALSIPVSRLTSPEFPKGFVLDGICLTIQAYFQTTSPLHGDMSISKHADTHGPIPQALVPGQKMKFWAGFGVILSLIGILILHLAGIFQNVMGLYLGFGFVLPGIILIIYAVWAATSRPH